MNAGPPPPWSYTRQQRAGLLLLIVVIALAYGLSSYLNDRQPVSFDDEALLSAAAQLRSVSSIDTPLASSAPQEFEFNPNTVAPDELQQLGLSAKQAAAFVKYRNARPFRRAEEIHKLYVLRPEQAARLVKLARLPNAEKPTTAAAQAPAPSNQNTPPQTFSFDPNTISADSFQLLGFSAREANTLLKYRSYRPITFRKPEDLLRVTAIDTTRVRSLLGKIDIALAPTDPAPAAPPPPAAPQPIDINTATVADFQTLPGIGPYRAEKLVEYRERLGGYASTRQVSFAYGLPDSVYQKIKPYLVASPVRKSLYINQMNAAELGQHPYLNRRTAEIIVRYRENHGPFTSVEDLKKVRALTTESLSGLLPYLNFAP